MTCLTRKMKTVPESDKSMRKRINKKSALAFLLACLVVTIPAAHARSSFGDGTSIDLILSCQAATKVFNSRNEQRLLASQRTSLSDALRAGYCLGALEHYRCPQGDNVRRSSFEAARLIAELDTDFYRDREIGAQAALMLGACF